MKTIEPELEGTKILVVDDNPNNIDVLAHALETRGYNIAIATSGEDALKTTDHFHPDLILLDLMMPGMDGLETCRRMKANPQHADIPIIIVTAAADTAAVVNSFAAGAVDYVVKPVREEEVLARVHTHLQLKSLIVRQERLIAELQGALDKVKVLSGMLPICASCKKIRNDQGYWEQIEQYISKHSDADFSHGICPECAQRLYPNYIKKPS